MFAVQAKERGARFGFVRTEGGVLALWGTPALARPGGLLHGGTRPPGRRPLGARHQVLAELPAEPTDIADRARLRRLLLLQPWKLSPDAAQ